MNKSFGCDKWIYITLLLFMSIVLTLTIKFHPVFCGETDEFVLTIEAYYNHFSPWIYETDKDAAMRDFPEFAEQISQQFDANAQAPVTFSKDGGHISWYPGVYSILCIPLKVILSYIGYPQIYTFYFTNILLWMISIASAIYYLDISTEKKWYLLLLYVFNPAIFYVVWPEFEFCIFAFVSLTCTFWMRKNYNLAAFCNSLAVAMNPTAAVIGMAVFCDMVYFFRNSNIAPRDFTKKIFCFIMSYGILWFFWGFNVYYFGTIIIGQFKILEFPFYDEYWGRVWAYLFDINLGIFPYEHLILFFSLFMLVYGIIFSKHSIRMFFWGLAFLGTLLAYALMPHISGGMSGILRYNMWLLPVLLHFFLLEYDAIFPIFKKCKWIISALVTLMVMWNGWLFYIFGGIGAPKGSGTMHTPLGKYVLDNVPSLYNPVKSIFLIRTSEVGPNKKANLDWGIYTNTWKGYAYYKNDYGFIRKILFSRNYKQEVMDAIESDSLSREYIASEVARSMESEKLFHYIDIPMQYSIYEHAESHFKRTEWNFEDFLPMNGAYKMYNCLILPPKSLFWGNRISLPPGDYLLTIEGENLSSLEARVSCGQGITPLKVDVIKDLMNRREEIVHVNSPEYLYYAEIPWIDFSHGNIGDKDIIISSIHVTHISNQGN